MKWGTTMSQYFLGIDPGAKGGFALIKMDVSIDTIGNGMAVHHPECEIVWTHRTDKHTWDEISDMLAQLPIGEDEPRVFIEAVHSMPKQGVKSMFSFGENYGTWKGILYALNLPFEKVRPQVWQKEILREFPKVAGKSTKDRVREWCDKFYCDDRQRWKFKSDDGICDALGIATYGALYHHD